MKTEYGLTREEANRAFARMRAETQSAKTKGALLTLDELTAMVTRKTWLPIYPRKKARNSRASFPPKPSTS